MTQVEFNSVSSKLMYHATLSRNQPGVLNKTAAQVSYAAITMISIAETVALLAISALSLLTSRLLSKPLKQPTKWLNSSAFTIGWSIWDFSFNLYLGLSGSNAKMIADEKSLREFLKNILVLKF